MQLPRSLVPTMLSALVPLILAASESLGHEGLEQGHKH